METTTVSTKPPVPAAIPSGEVGSGPPRILAIDDDGHTLNLLERALTVAGWQVCLADSGAAGLALYEQAFFDVVLLDLVMPEMDGFAVLERIRALDKSAVVVIMTGQGSTDSVVQAMRLGAVDYLNKPLDLDHLEIVLDKTLRQREQTAELQLLRGLLDLDGAFAGMVGTSPAMQRVYSLVQRLAPSDTTVLVSGETGTGKEMVARALHDLSARRDQSFMAINCGALTETILESELFGHEKGSFTGAVKQKYGLIEQAEGGTLFLDEIEDMSPALQVKLLRAIQEREVLRVGGTQPIQVDFRLVAATNTDLRECMEQGLFRADLFYRLNVATIDLPPLRQRMTDVPLLVEHFLRQHRDKGAFELAPEALMRLKTYAWPGNVRELQNTIEQAVMLCEDSIIQVDELPSYVAVSQEPAIAADLFSLPFREARERFEREYFAQMLCKAEGKVAAAARLAGIPRQYYYEKMHRYDISRAEYQASAKTDKGVSKD